MNMGRYAEQDGTDDALDERGDATTADGVVVLGEEDEFREGILDSSSSFKWVQMVWRQKE
jgi:hypothetical protein